MTHEAIIGASFRFVYSDETYRIDVTSEAQLRWTREIGEQVGQADTESYIFDQPSDDVILLTWIEADGLGLSNAMNLADGSLITHANQGREVFQNKGRHTFEYP